MSTLPPYEESLNLFHDWTKTESLRKHAYAVEAAMAAYAEYFGEDELLWRTTGLLHDMDYEKHPTAEEHPFIGTALLTDLGYPDEIIQAILGHATYSGVARTTRLAKALFAVDELAGFITAVAYVRPTRLAGMTPRSVKKKLKDKQFAAAVSRDDIALGVQELAVDLDEHISRVIGGMQKDASRLGFEQPA
ncbi:MAG: HDIG domain-containing protein [Rhodothermales bacterium]|nr:HDIG domain-containing protein [Rhodothermales bacterium]